ncbi:MAG TPA: DUF2797 domain-containing protein [Streptosporangiaceae bacterium]
MTEPLTALRSTGLHWESGSPVLTATRPAHDLTSRLRPGLGRQGQPEHKRVLALGQRIDWTLRGARGCCGIWTGSHRIACPLNSALEDGTDPQCAACAAADRGKALARDAITDDGRTYGLYLAWFGPGLLKIGLTAAERGRDRLLEQGAIAYTMLAAGPYPGIRYAERLISASGLARERIPAHAKSTAWWALPAAAGRSTEITVTRARITGQMTWPASVEETSGPVVDQAGDFGLDRAFPSSWDEVTAVTGGARPAGKVIAIVGRQILLDTSPGHLLIDMRRVAGWSFTSGAVPDARPAATGLTTTTRTRPKELDDSQHTLF